MIFWDVSSNSLFLIKYKYERWTESNEQPRIILRTSKVGYVVAQVLTKYITSAP